VTRLLPPPVGFPDPTLRAEENKKKKERKKELVSQKVPEAHQFIEAM